jgi:predicted nucleotidyltransferase component of viral defense system
MNRVISKTTNLHADPDFFRAAVSYTAQRTAFAARLIEKDYFCSVLLEYLASANDALVFKGGTCLAKVYAGFYRLSEDLDFVISMPIQAKRTDRSRQAAALKRVIAELSNQLPAFQVIQPLTGANNSTQYVAMVGYQSIISKPQNTIKIEVGLREPLLTAVHIGSANAILLNPVSDRPLIHPVSLRCISRNEAFAEKIRAAMTRREVAIRDFYDIEYATRRLDIHFSDGELIKLVGQKLAVPGNPPVDISPQRMEALRQQRETQLRPVLRESDYSEFDLERAIQTVVGMARNF